LAASFRLQSSEPGRNRNVSLQDDCRPVASRPNSAQSADGGKNRLQRAQPDDDARHAHHRPDPLIGGATAQTQPAVYSSTSLSIGPSANFGPLLGVSSNLRTERAARPRLPQVVPLWWSERMPSPDTWIILLQPGLRSRWILLIRPRRLRADPDGVSAVGSPHAG
jgi:hypothetical protein